MGVEVGECLETGVDSWLLAEPVPLAERAHRSEEKQGAMGDEGGKQGEAKR